MRPKDMWFANQLQVLAGTESLAIALMRSMRVQQGGARGYTGLSTLYPDALCIDLSDLCSLFPCRTGLPDDLPSNVLTCVRSLMAIAIASVYA